MAKKKGPFDKAHAALIENGIVRQIIVIPYLEDDDLKITEYCNANGLPGTWIDTSYLSNRRSKYAAVGDLWDGTNFISPEPPPAEPVP
jgi:hypothetical protein